MRYVEFYNHEFIRENYLLASPPESLQPYIDFFWESNYNPGLAPFSVRTFPRLGSTLLFNLKGSFGFIRGAMNFQNAEHIFYTRDQIIETTHSPRSKLFGVQFKVNLPLLIQANSSRTVSGVQQVKCLEGQLLTRMLDSAATFKDRIAEIEKYFLNQITVNIEYKARVIHTVLKHSTGISNNTGLADWTEKVPYSRKTIERYFLECTGTSPFKAIQMVQTRMALFAQWNDRKNFNPLDYGFYDFSHYCKCIRRLGAG